MPCEAVYLRRVEAGFATWKLCQQDARECVYCICETMIAYICRHYVLMAFSFLPGFNNAKSTLSCSVGATRNSLSEKS